MSFFFSIDPRNWKKVSIYMLYCWYIAWYMVPSALQEYIHSKPSYALLKSWGHLSYSYYYSTHRYWWAVFNANKCTSICIYDMCTVRSAKLSKEHVHISAFYPNEWNKVLKRRLFWIVDQTILSGWESWCLIVSNVPSAFEYRVYCQHPSSSMICIILTRIQIMFYARIGLDKRIWSKRWSKLRIIKNDYCGQF